MSRWHGRCIGNIRMKHILIYKWLMIRKEHVNNTNAQCSNGSEISKIRKLAQHYLNGLRISAFLIRAAFNRMKVRHFVSIYEACIYPILYRRLIKIN